MILRNVLRIGCLAIFAAALQSEIGSSMLSVQQATVKAKTKSRFGLDTVDVALSIELRSCQDLDGKIKCKNAKIGYKGSGTSLGP